MWNNYFLQIRKKYSMRVSSKNPLIINLDGKDVTKNNDINILEMYKGSFRYSMDKAAAFFTEKYNCLCIIGGDEISFIIENPIELVNDLNSDNDMSSVEISSMFSQYFFEYFNKFYENDIIFFHGKCYSINSDKIKSFIKYKSKLIVNLVTTYFLKKKDIHNFGNTKLSEKIKMCNEYIDYKKFSDIENGILYYKGKKINLQNFLDDRIIEIEDIDNSVSSKNIEFDETNFSDIL
ncbi:MAG: hypothetical protein RR144_05220 [Clostridia bacterium]